MAAGRKRRAGAPAIDLIEEAIHLARHTPLRAWLAYYTGAFPFTLGLLYFWSDMSRGAFAREHVVEASLLLALLFVWMKCWQTVFAVNLRAQLGGASREPWTAGRIARMVLVQAILLPPALFLRPIVLLITLPYAWTHAFYQNVIVLGDGRTSDPRSVARAAADQARLWPGQNHAALGILHLFGLLVWLNAGTAMASAPFLLKSLLGVETMFTRSPFSLLFNTTFLASVCVVTYLCADPFFKAFYVLRCFYGQSLKSGADLRVELGHVRSSVAAAAVAALVILVLCLTPISAAAAAEPVPEATPVSAPSGIGPARLDREIEDVLQRPEFSWRLPRKAMAKEERGVIAAFFDGVFKTVGRWLRPVRESFKKLIEWIEKWIASRAKPTGHGEGFGGVAEVLKLLVYFLSAIAVGTIAWIIWQRWRQRRKPREVTAEIVPASPDLESEEIVASQLPEDEWLRLSRQMIDQGELRLALRALYLGSLAHLGARQMLTIARYKSNAEYERELRRRARSRADLLHAFHDNLSAFERVWYGRHPATLESLDKFRGNLDEIRTC